MLPMKLLRLALGNLLAADATTLAPAMDANKTALIAAAFNLNENLALGSLTLATFTGSAPKVGAAGAQQVGTDPLTGDQVITILAPAGGWRWECSAAPGAPQTIFGFCLLDNAAAVLLAAEVLDNPIVITNVGDFIDLGQIPMRFVIQPLS